MKQPENTGVEMSSALEQEKTKMRLQDIFMAYCVNLMIWMWIPSTLRALNPKDWGRQL